MPQERLITWRLKPRAKTSRLKTPRERLKTWRLESRAKLSRLNTSVGHCSRHPRAKTSRLKTPQDMAPQAARQKSRPRRLETCSGVRPSRQDFSE
ncbi:hypothetical protein DFH08DRAFT_946736 [Mycena albidolilacea]|uniref:Uncharacterized protein n=1 Tax=Mycena albidolilacea TaxID=1033008 RepID=A0AAD7ATL2_9AGAR|nr:hypothetical protein DFH08DRAFT_946736 [Mycena albidolilacea]